MFFDVFQETLHYASIFGIILFITRYYVTFFGIVNG